MNYGGGVISAAGDVGGSGDDAKDGDGGDCPRSRDCMAAALSRRVVTCS